MRQQVFTLALENFLFWNCWRTCLLCLLFNYLCGVCVCVHFYAQYNVFLPERVCHEHHFGLNSRIAAPKFCTKSRFYFLRRNLFEQFAPTLPKSKIAWMEILFSAIWAKLKVLTISSLQFSQQFWLFSTPCNTHLPSSHINCRYHHHHHPHLHHNQHSLRHHHHRHRHPRHHHHHLIITISA